MATAQFEPYCREVEQQMWNFFRSLSEKDQRRYAALQAVQWGMVASSMWPVFWSVRLGRSVAALVIWNSFPMIPLQAGSAGSVLPTSCVVVIDASKDEL